MKKILLIILLLFFTGARSSLAARVDQPWEEINGSYLQTSWDDGRDILINGVNKHINFFTTSGDAGYGFRDNGGVMQFSNSGGPWTNFGSSGNSFGKAWELVGGYLKPTTTVTTYHPLGLITAASSTFQGQSNFIGTLAASSTALFTNGFEAFASSTLQNFTAFNGTTTNATSTTFAVTSLAANSLVASNGFGGLVSTSTIGNNQLQNSFVTVNTATPLNGGGALSLGGILSLGWSGVSTSTNPTIGQLSYWTSTAGALGSVATSTLSASSPLTGSFTQVGSSGSLGCQTASGSQAGCLSSGDWTTFNGKQATISVNSPLNLNGTTIGWSGLATSSAGSISNILYFTSTSGVGNVATSTLTASSPLTGSFPHIGTTGSLGCQTASGSQAGCLASGDWTTFNNKQATISVNSPLTLNGAVIGWSGVATSTIPSISNLAYWTSTTGNLGSVATTSETCTSPISCTAHAVLTGGGAITLNTVPIASGGTNNTVLQKALLWFDGTSISATSSQVTVGSIVATTTATSLFTGALNTLGDLRASSTALFTNGFTAYASSTLQNLTFVNATGTAATTTSLSTTIINQTTNATSSFAGGINITSTAGGCHAIRGACLARESSIFSTTTPSKSGKPVTINFTGAVDAAPAFTVAANSTLALPINTAYFTAEIFGGGGAGGGNCTTAAAGGSGGSSDFGNGGVIASSTANGAGGGSQCTSTVQNGGGAQPGTANGGDLNLSGQGGTNGGSGVGGAITGRGGTGGSAPRGGGGGNPQAGGGAPGGGGGGEQGSSGTGGGGGGGGGSYSEKLVGTPSGLYYYDIGPGGAAVNSEGAGANGGIIITTYTY